MSSDAVTATEVQVIVPAARLRPGMILHHVPAPCGHVTEVLEAYDVDRPEGPRLGLELGCECGPHALVYLRPEDLWTLFVLLSDVGPAGSGAAAVTPE